MFFQINNLEITSLEKANKPGIISVKIIANHLTEDDEGETLLKSAFDQDTVQSFLETGVIDWWHNSHNSERTDAEQAESILGKPTSFVWENGKPVVFADLTESHPVVQKMIPHLNVGNPVYAASVGGSKMVMKVKDQNQNEKRIVPKIKWNHLAIAPINSVINRSPGVNISILKKANDILVNFDNMAAFQSQSNHFFAKEEQLQKALLAPSSPGELYSTAGGVLTKQSLEKSTENLTLSENEALLLLGTVLGIKENEIPDEKNLLLDYFERIDQRNFGDKFYRLIDKYYKLKGA